MKLISISQQFSERKNGTKCFAAFDAAEQYRWLLSRNWFNPAEPHMSPPTMCFVMLNPSTADGLADDPTIRKCMGFAARWQLSAIEVVNLYAYRATDPDELLGARARGVDIRGGENAQHIEAAIRRADKLVFAWGSTKVPGREHFERHVSELALHLGKWPMCFGVTKDGSPKHPLYLSYETNLLAWDVDRRHRGSAA
ncbi:MAG: hypothetical protein DI536_28825 [Archangium gephyra]|uniref:DUF1643 domain-containing protein n=1 Tax=Archangium gephyra TaxID=48 RepID=A0A2W5T2G4_9BACT|nr:MAG: hypothetical protein DI536_28825 [Archangium gephyra]